jgi:hypothetical protein
VACSIASLPIHVVSVIVGHVVSTVNFQEAHQLRLINRQTLYAAAARLSVDF